MQKPNSTAADSMVSSVGLKLADPLVFSKFLTSLNISNQSDDSLSQFVSDKLKCDFKLYTHRYIMTYTSNDSITQSSLFPNLNLSVDFVIQFPNYNGPTFVNEFPTWVSIRNKSVNKGRDKEFNFHQYQVQLVVSINPNKNYMTPFILDSIGKNLHLVYHMSLFKDVQVMSG